MLDRLLKYRRKEEQRSLNFDRSKQNCFIVSSLENEWSTGKDYKLNVEKRDTSNTKIQLLLPQQAQIALLLPTYQCRLFLESFVFVTTLSSRIPNHSLLPVFNHDLQYYTPTFILSNEKVTIYSSSPTHKNNSELNS